MNDNEWRCLGFGVALGFAFGVEACWVLMRWMLVRPLERLRREDT